MALWLTGFATLTAFAINTNAQETQNSCIIGSDSSQCIKIDECVDAPDVGPKDSKIKLCLYNFRQAGGGLLRYDWSYATSLLSTKSIPNPPYAIEEWSPFWKSTPTYSVELDCKNGTEIIGRGKYRLTRFGGAICGEFLQTTSSNLADKPELVSTSASNVQERSESDFRNTRSAGPSLYQTLSDTPFFWKTR